MFDIKGDSKIFSQSFCDSMRDKDDIQIMSLLQNVDVPSLKDHYQKTLLHIAAAFGNEEIANYLIDSGCDVDAQDSLGYTPLILAIQYNYPNVVNILINADADVFLLNSRQMSAYAFVVILRHQRHESFDIIFLNTLQDERVLMHTSLAENIKKRDHMKKGPGNYDEELIHSNPCLCFSSLYYKYPEVIEMNLLYRADPVQMDDYGNTALHALAVINGDNFELFQQLLDHGADINVRNCREITPLHLACAFGNVNYVKCLLRRGADVNAKDLQDCTPLYAALMCHVEYHTIPKDCQPLIYKSSTSESHQMAWLLLDNSALIDECLVTRCSRMNVETEELHHYLLHHIARIEAKTSCIPVYCREAIQRFPCCQSYYKQCCKELQAMKTHLQCDDVTFFDLLTENLARIACYVRNENFLKAFESCDLYRCFPLYYACLKNRFESGIERTIFFKKASAIVKYVMPFLDSDHLVLRKIVSYINEDDLRNINYPLVNGFVTDHTENLIQSDNPVEVNNYDDSNDCMPPQDKKKKYTQL